MATFAALKDSYTALWNRMEIRSDKLGIVNSIALRLTTPDHKKRYQSAEAKTGVPWFVIAALHNRESDADFKTYLGNGESLNRVTRLVPKGRGPFSTWEAGAIDALKIDGLDKVSEWTPERACYEIEKFNGFGYRGKGINSPYLWSYSNNYSSGKYVSDGVWSSSAVDKQCGAIPILKKIMERDATARFKPRAKTPDVVAGGGAGTAAGGVAHLFGIEPVTAILIGIAVAVAVTVVISIIRKRS